MAKYNGSDLQKVTPKFRNPNRESITDDQVNSWWDAVVNGVGTDKDIQQKIGDGKNLYYFSDTGDLVPALPNRVNAENVNVRRHLMEQSIDGRLFTRAFGHAAPRQIVTDPNADFEVGVANGENPWDLPQPESPGRPEAPSFLKYLLYPFFRREILAYQQAKEAYAEFLQQGRWIRSIDSNDEYLVQDRMEERTAPYRDQPSQSQADLELAQPVRSKDIANMTPEAFQQYLTDMGNCFDPNFRSQVRKIPNVTSDQYYDAVATQMECLIAKDMLALGEEDPKYFSAEYRVLFQALSNGLDEFVRAKLDKALVDSFLNFGVDAPGLLELSGKERFLLSPDGVDEYQQAIAKQNEAKEQSQNEQLQSEPLQNEQDAPKQDAAVLSGMA